MVAQNRLKKVMTTHVHDAYRVALKAQENYFFIIIINSLTCPQKDQLHSENLLYYDQIKIIRV